MFDYEIRYAIDKIIQTKIWVSTNGWVVSQELSLNKMLSPVVILRII